MPAVASAFRAPSLQNVCAAPARGSLDGGASEAGYSHHSGSRFGGGGSGAARGGGGGFSPARSEFGGVPSESEFSEFSQQPPMRGGSAAPEARSEFGGARGASRRPHQAAEVATEQDLLRDVLYAFQVT